MRGRYVPLWLSISLCSLSLASAIPPAVGALELRLNGKSLVLPSEKEFPSLLYSLTVDGRAERGIALSELTPPLADAWRLEVRRPQVRGPEAVAGSGTGSGSAGGQADGQPGGQAAQAVWDTDDLAERLDRCYLLEGRDGAWNLAFDGKALRGIGSIELLGSRADERAPEVWVSWEGTGELKKEVERWSRLVGVKAKTVDVPDIRSKLLSVQRGGGRMPDLVMVQSDYLPSFIAASSLQPLDGMDASRLSGKGRDAFTASGRIWALPFYFDAQLVFYNPALLSRRPARTWTLDDMEAEARLVAGSGRTPMAWNAYSAYWLLPFALGFGKAGIEDSDGAVRPDDAGTGKALSWLLRMRDEKLLAVLERDAMMGRFASGETAMILTASYSIPEFERLGIPFGIAAYPTVPETGSPVAPFLDFKGFAVTRASRSPITARRLAAHLTGSGVQQRFTAAVSKLPANSDAWELVRSANRYFPELERSAEIGVVVPSSESWSTYKNIMWKMLRFVFAGSMGVDEALAEARRLVDANFKN